MWGETNLTLGRLTKRFSRRLSLIAGVALLLLLILVSLFVPLLSPYDAYQIHPEQSRLPPSAAHPLGTDETGRDVLIRLLYSIRLAYAGGLFATLITTLGGGTLGLWVGYRGGWVDVVLMRLVDIWLALPGLLFLLVIVALLGRETWQVVLAVGLAGIPGFARVVRGQTMQEKSRPYVDAANAVGATPLRIMFRHILPNILVPLGTLLAIRFGGAILAVGSLSFIGFGVQQPTPDLGGLLGEGREFMRFAPWRTLGPVAVLWLTMLGTNLISDGLAARNHR